MSDNLAHANFEIVPESLLTFSLQNLKLLNVRANVPFWAWLLLGRVVNGVISWCPVCSNSSGFTVDNLVKKTLTPLYNNVPSKSMFSLVFHTAGKRNFQITGKEIILNKDFLWAYCLRKIALFSSVLKGYNCCHLHDVLLENWRTLFDFLQIATVPFLFA